MHSGDARAVAGHPDEPSQSLRPRLHQRFERAAGTRRGFPFVVFDQVVELDQIDVIDLQTFE